MKIKALRHFRNDIGMVRRGDEVTVRDADARSLIKRGLAVAIEEAPEPETAKSAGGRGKPGAKSAPK